MCEISTQCWFTQDKLVGAPISVQITEIRQSLSVDVEAETEITEVVWLSVPQFITVGFNALVTPFNVVDSCT